MDCCGSEVKKSAYSSSKEVKKHESCYQRSDQLGRALVILSYRGLFSTSRGLVQARHRPSFSFTADASQSICRVTVRMLGRAIGVPTRPGTMWAHKRNLFGLIIRNNSTFPEQFVSIGFYEWHDSYKSINLIVEITSPKGMPELDIFKLLYFLLSLHSSASIPAPLRISLGRERRLQWEYGDIFEWCADG